MKQKSQKVCLKSIQQLIRLPLMFTNGGFTLIEILVAVLIIGILAAIAVPQYQRALLKSRYAALMPIAKSMANSNEAYYLEHGIYADDPQDLLIQGQSRYTDDTELEFGTVSDYAYVLAKNEDKIPNNTFVVYQKHSGEFPGEIHCEALANNDLAESVCKSFGGNESIGKTLTDGYETYVLFGTGNGVAPSGDNGGNDEPETSVCEGVSCDDQGNITECASGLTLNNGSCEDCATAFPGAATCSATSYAPTTCSDGYTLNATGTACEPVPTTCGGVTQPADMVINNGSITGTTSCVDGKWIWQWTGEKEMNSDCNAVDTTTCSNAIYGPEMKYCHGGTANACANSVFTGTSYCYGNTAKGCSNSVFLGYNGCSSQYAKGVCTNSTFLGTGICKGYHSGDCAGSKFYPGSYCREYEENACSETKYAYDENGNIGFCSGSTCPKGVPLNSTGTAWHGGYCNPNFMVSGTCPAGSPKQGGGTW